MFKPMLAGTVDDTSVLKFPIMASPKLDGIRAMVIDGVLVSRNMKPIPNRHAQELFGHAMLNGLDGELIVGPVGAADVFRATSSGVMSVEGHPDVIYHVFDCMEKPERPFHNRLELARNVAKRRKHTVVVNHVAVNHLDELDAYESTCLAQGYEGVMLRNFDAPYKFGRGTLRAQDLLKLKRFADAEARVIDAYEQYHNANEATTDALGRTVRSSHKAGMVGKGVLGGLTVIGINGPYKGKGFNIGSGFNDDQRHEFWALAGADGRALDGRIVKYKYFPSGSKDAPRFPVFLGWREEGDM